METAHEIEGAMKLIISRHFLHAFRSNSFKLSKTIAEEILGGSTEYLIFNAGYSKVKEEYQRKGEGFVEYVRDELMEYIEVMVTLGVE